MSQLRIDVADLLSHPGARRGVRLAAAVDGLAGTTTRVEAPVDLDLLLERVSEGVVVRGTVRARFEGDCSHCLQGIAADLEVAVSELYEDHPIDGETYPLEGHVINLEQLVRDAVLLELPLAPTCESVGAAPCAGPPVPADVAGDTDDATGPADPRWSVLSELEL